jgi:hypothetical protein
MGIFDDILGKRQKDRLQGPGRASRSSCQFLSRVPAFLLRGCGRALRPWA